mmetsp:Transcript_35123/g.91212  ORF Transcript_35123/g.91212 Transcript_35123/m.91212 type:complete len:344 (-) Transcript_35123:73-1104(-)
MEPPGRQPRGARRHAALRHHALRRRIHALRASQRSGRAARQARHPAGPQGGRGRQQAAGAAAAGGHRLAAQGDRQAPRAQARDIARLLHRRHLRVRPAQGAGRAGGQPVPARARPHAGHRGGPPRRACAAADAVPQGRVRGVAAAARAAALPAGRRPAVPRHPAGGRRHDVRLPAGAGSRHAGVCVDRRRAGRRGGRAGVHRLGAAAERGALPGAGGCRRTRRLGRRALRGGAPGAGAAGRGSGAGGDAAGAARPGAGRTHGAAAAGHAHGGALAAAVVPALLCAPRAHGARPHLLLRGGGAEELTRPSRLRPTGLESLSRVALNSAPTWRSSSKLNTSGCPA